MEIFAEGNHKVIWDDSIEALENCVQDNSVDLIFVDPPYNIGKVYNGKKHSWKTDMDYMEWCYKWIDLCIAKIKDSGSMYIMTED